MVTNNNAVPKKTYLEEVKASIAEIEKTPSFENFSLQQVFDYNTLLKKEYVLKMGKMLLGSAPQSMNPTKVKEHFKMAYSWLNQEPFINKELLATTISQIFPGGIDNYMPNHVQDYKNRLGGIILPLMKELKK